MPATPRDFKWLDATHHDVTDLSNLWFWEEELHEVQPPPWLIENTIPLRSVNMLFGDFNLGKTFLALDWAASVASGITWRGLDTKQGDVLYIASEGDPGNLGLRMQAWKENLNRQGENLRILFYTAPTGISQIGELLDQAIADGARPVLVIIDTLAMAMDDQENDNTAMNAAVRELRSRQVYSDEGMDYELAYLLVHHVGWSNDGRPRGGSAMPGGLDNIISMQADSKTDLIKVKMYKGKNMDKKSWGERYFSIEPVGESAVLRAVTSDDAKAAVTQVHPGVLAIVEYLCGVEDLQGHEFQNKDIVDTMSVGKERVSEGMQRARDIGIVTRIDGGRKHQATWPRQQLIEYRKVNG